MDVVYPDFLVQIVVDSKTKQEGIADVYYNVQKTRHT